MEQYILHNIKIINDLMEKRANSALSKYNITLSQARILATLYNSKAESISLKAMEKLFNVSQATMQGTISRLAKKGYVTTCTSEHDKRTKYVAITPSGSSVISHALKCLAETNNSIMNCLSSAEVAEFNRILGKIAVSLK